MSCRMPSPLFPQLECLSTCVVLIPIAMCSRLFTQIPTTASTVARWRSSAGRSGARVHRRAPPTWNFRSTRYSCTTLQCRPASTNRTAFRWFAAYRTSTWIIAVDTTVFLITITDDLILMILLYQFSNIIILMDELITSKSMIEIPNTLCSLNMDTPSNTACIRLMS